MMKTHRDTRGSTLLLVLILMVSMAVFSVGYLFMAQTAITATKADEEGIKAMYFAEAGVDRAIYYLTTTAPDGSTDASWRTSAYPAAAGSGDDDPRSESLAAGSYTMWVTTAGGDVLITSRGTVAGIERVVYQKINTGDLAGWWKFDEGAGTVAKDISSGGYDGTLENDPSWVAGRVGPKALQFDGTNDTILVPSSLGVGTTTFTVALWVNLSSTSKKGPFVKIGGNNANGFGFGVGNTNFDDLGNNLIVLYELVAWYNTGKKIGTGWHHVALVVDGSSDFKTYIDGQLSATVNAGTPLAPSEEMRIGGYQFTYSGTPYVRYANAQIDDVRILNTALTQPEIEEIYNGRTGFEAVSGSWGMN